MPTYLVHGFRWPRPLIRIHIILQNLEDAAAEWLIAPLTSKVMLENFDSLYPDVTRMIPHLRFVEQYDPEDESIKSQPYAYVCDIVHEIKLGADIDEIRGRGVDGDAWASMLDLRDKIAPDEKVAWFVVVCGDTERLAPEGDGSNGSVYTISRTSASGEETVTNSPERSPAEEKAPRGLRKWFGGNGLRKAKSFKDLRQSLSRPSTSAGYSRKSSSPLPPLPPVPNFSTRGVTPR